jgi:hypothetical protein
LRRAFRVREFPWRDSFVCRKPEMPNPDPSGSSDTRPRNERLRSHREIADRDFLLHDFLTIENSDSPIYDSTGSSDTRPRTMDSPDLIGKSHIAISICMSLLFPETPISRSPIFVRSLTPVPCEQMAQILSVNHESRFRVARVLCTRNPRYVELRLSGILCHVSLLLGWLRSCRGFHLDFSEHLSPGRSISRW